MLTAIMKEYQSGLRQEGSLSSESEFLCPVAQNYSKIITHLELMHKKFS